METDHFTKPADDASTLGSTVSNVETKAHTAVDSAATKARDSLSSAAEAAHDTLAKAASKAQDAGAALNDAKDAAIDKAQDSATKLSTPIKQNPLTAVAGAFAIGYLIARLGN